MNTKAERNYFKIGTFVLIGLGLIIFALLVFGSSSLFEPIVYLETYFDESVQGISEGSPVKYRGLQIGHVEEISFVDEVYKNPTDSMQMHNRAIYVQVAITSKLFTRLPYEKMKNLLTAEIHQGLRIKLVTQGLTGTSYLELDYVNPVTSQPPMVFNWTPKYFYVPSATSTLARLSENAQYIMNELKNVKFKQIFDNIDLLVNSMFRVVSRVENTLDPVDNSLATTLQNFQTVSNNLRIITEQLKVNPSGMVFGKPPPPLNPRKL